MKAKPRKSNLSVSFLRVIVLVVFAAFIAFIGYEKIIEILKHSTYFKIKDIWYESSLRSIESSELAVLKGKSLLTVDLKKVQEQLQRRYPQYRQLQVVKRYPNQVLVVARQRFPFAKLRLAGKTLTLDDKSVILSAGGNNENNLPLIMGVESVRGRIAAGSQIDGVDLRVAMAIITMAQSDRVLSYFPIIKIDVSNLSEIHFFLSNNLKIIVDQDRLEHKLKMLALVLSQTKLEKDNVGYIDLRFKEPVLGKK